METQEFRAQLQQSILRSDIVRIFDNLLTIAVEEGASDIHIEPMENYSRIRLRIDGVLVELIQYPRSLHESIISKFKIESGQMRPDEKRLPQDARVSSITQTNKEIDLRANTLPTVWGEKLVMRIVDKSKSIPPLNQLGIIGSNKVAIEKHLKDPNGILLNTGPTGSGKTTTLYAALNEINTIERNIITYEDPVENKMSGLNQSQVRSDIWYTFHSGLRSALRQDPDVIMVGEMRDSETIKSAITLAETGHIVFSTLHTNDSVQTVDRIVDAFPPAQQSQIRMQLSQTLIWIISQRLLPRADWEWRIPAREILVADDAVKNLIINWKTHQLYSVLEVWKEKWMILMDKYLLALYTKKMITKDILLAYARDRENIEMMIS